MNKMLLLMSVAILALSVGESMADEVATSGTCGDDCTWSIVEGTLKVVGAIQNYGDGGETPWVKLQRDHNVVINTVDASEVTKLGKCSFEHVQMTSVIMPQSITRIPTEAFRDCHKLKNIELPDSITLISHNAFTKMTELESITIPDSAKFYSENIFNDSKITTIYCKGDISVCRVHLESKGLLTDSRTLLTAPEEKCNSDGYYYNGKSCEHRPADANDMVCIGGYAKLKGNCVDPLKTFAKKHWTPAEVNEWLKDEDNTITITFKIQ